MSNVSESNPTPNNPANQEQKKKRVKIKKTHLNLAPDNAANAANATIQVEKTAIQQSAKEDSNSVCETFKEILTVMCWCICVVLILAFVGGGIALVAEPDMISNGKEAGIAILSISGTICFYIIVIAVVVYRSDIRVYNE